MTDDSQLPDRFANLSPAKRALLEKRLRGEQTAVSSPPTTIQPRPAAEPLHVSPAQERLWFLHQLNPASAAYNMHEAVAGTGRLHPEALQYALDGLVARHDALRTTFHASQGQPVPHVAPTQPLTLTIVDLQALPDGVQQTEVQIRGVQEAQRPFNLQTGPLLRLTLLQLSPDAFVLLLTMHHIIGDEWSLEQFWRELRELYRAQLSGSQPTLPSLPIRYTDYAAWQRDQLVAGQFQTDLDYWQKQLRGELPLLQLPLDHPRPAALSDAGEMRQRSLPPALLPALQKLAQANGATLFMTLLTAFQVLLHRYSQQRDILVGTPIANRSHPETQHLLGLFLNTLVLRAQVDGPLTFTQLLAQTRQQMLDGFAHQELPIEQVVQAIQPQRDPALTPLFQVMFVYQQAQPVLDNWPGISLEKIMVDGGVAKFDLTLFVTETADRLAAALEYRTALFEAATIDRMLAHFTELLTAIVAAPDTAVSQLNLLPAAERERVVTQWNQTAHDALAAAPPQIHHFIEQVAQQTPEAAAVIFDGQQYTYAELNRKANQLARHLQANGVGSDTVAAVCLPRSFEMIVAILAILKASGAYLPLDPGYPTERLAWMLADAQAVLLITQAELAASLPAQTPTLLLAHSQQAIARQSGDDLATAVSPHALAYLIYTSGSTGQPKGVMVSHKNLVHSTLARQLYYPRLVSRFLLLSSVAFDSSIAGIFGTLCQGGGLVLPKQGQEHNVQQLAQLIDAANVSHMLALPSLYSLLLEGAQLSQLASLTDVIVAGEACTADLVTRHYGRLPHTTLYNEYGPTEGTVWATVHAISPDWDGQNVPIGKPIPNATLYLLDGQQQPVPIGVPGEIYIGGAGIVPGYWQQPTLTAERFVQLPWLGQQRLYRTGDLGRFLPDGSVQFLGRVDQQVKIRGYRVELGEIEAALKQAAGGVETAVLIHKNGAGIEQLVAYVAANEALPHEQTLRTRLKHQLPDYMVPARILPLAALPRTPNGKLDRAALPRPEAMSANPTSAPPQNETEQTIAQIWGDLLQTAQVGRDDNFFALGGHSLLATQVMSRVQQAFSTVLPLQSLFNAPTVAALAAAVAEAQQTAVSTTPPTIGRAARQAYRRQN